MALGAGCFGIKVCKDAMKLTSMIIAAFGHRRNSVCEGEMFIKNKAEFVSILVYILVKSCIFFESLF